MVVGSISGTCGLVVVVRDIGKFLFSIQNVTAVRADKFLRDSITAGNVLQDSPDWSLTGIDLNDRYGSYSPSIL